MKILVNKVFEKSTQSEPIYYIVPRTVSQDPLENMFGSVRSHCGNNRNHNVKQFIAALKPCIVKNFAFNEVSQGANCQADVSSLLRSLRTLLSIKTCEKSNDIFVDEVDSQGPLIETDSYTDTSSLPSESTAYCSGFIAKRVLSTNSCKLGILSTNPHESHSLGLLFGEYNNDKEGLTYLSENLAKPLSTVSLFFKHC